MLRSLRENQKPVAAFVYVATMFMAILDTTIVNVALPSLSRDLHTDSSRVGLVPIAYLVSLTVFIPAAGWLGDWFGGRRALLGAIGVFTIGSTLCGISTSFGELVAFSALQGVGGAVMLPVGLAILFRVYPPAERTRISSTIAVFTGLAPALGPILGGVFTTYVSWRLVFFVNVPIGVAAFIVGAILLSGHTQPEANRLDVPGLALSSLGLGALMFGVTQGPIQGWVNAEVMASITAGLAMLIFLIIVELTVDDPLIDLRLLGNRLFAASASIYALASVSYIGGLYLLALFLQDGLGMSAIQTGLATFPSALGVMAGGQIVTRLLYWRIGPRRIIAGGMVLVAAMLAAMTQVSTDTSVWTVRLVMLGLGIGISFAFISAQAASMATITKSQTGRASAIYNAGKQLGSAVGIALLGTVLAAADPGSQSALSSATLTGFHAGFLAAAITGAITAVVAFAIRDSDARTTMISPRARQDGAAKNSGPSSAR